MRHRTLLGAGLAMAALGAALAGVGLVNDHPQRGDVIVVLNGGTWARETGGLRRLDQGYGRRLLIDVDREGSDWGQSDVELARGWIARLPERGVDVCPIGAHSTMEEAREVQGCLRADERRVPLVTSAYHTGRALAIFRHTDPGRAYSAAAVAEPAYFGEAWWRRREWAKTTSAEWLKMAWWEAIDRWR